MTRHAEHYLKRETYKGHDGDRPEPWQIDWTCGCGAELLFEEEGLSSPALIPMEALEEHITEVNQ